MFHAVTGFVFGGLVEGVSDLGSANTVAA